MKMFEIPITISVKLITKGPINIILQQENAGNLIIYVNYICLSLRKFSLNTWRFYEAFWGTEYSF